MKNVAKNFLENSAFFYLRRVFSSGVGRFLTVENQNFKRRHFFFLNKIGLEIGGPSAIFGKNGSLPVYAYAQRVDGCNFSKHTLWEGLISGGPTYAYADGKIGTQFIAEGTHLVGIADESYDFVIASHSIEHFANPLKAIDEWLRVLKPSGVLLVIAPDKRFTFDHRRCVTPFDDLLNHYKLGTDEYDLSHLDEILSLHDLSMDRGAGTFENFVSRSKANYQNRCLHQHVFDKKLLRQVFNYFGVDVLFLGFSFPYNNIIMGRKIAGNQLV